MNPKRSALGLITLLTLSLLGLANHAYLGTYSRFIADDYCSAAEALKLGVFRAAWYWYITWTGRYSANLLDAIFGILGPGFTPAVTILVLITWLVALATAIFLVLPKRKAQPDLLISATLAAAILFITVTLTPDVQQSLYWSQGMRSVVPPLILGTCFMCIFRYVNSHNFSGRSLIGWWSLSLILSFVAGGFSETFTVFQFSILVLAIGISLIYRQYIVHKGSFYFLVSGFLGAALSLLAVIKAPGNQFRQVFYPTPPALPILLEIALKSYGMFFAGIFGSLAKVLGLVGALAIGVLVGTLFDSLPITTRTPFLIMVFGLGLVFSCFPPSAYGLSDAPPDRTLVIPTYGLVLTLVIFGFTLGSLITQQYQVFNLILAASLLLIAGVAALTVYQTISTRQIYINYAEGWGKFHAQMLAFQQKGVENAVITTQEMNSNNWVELDVLGDNPKFWLNKCVSDYYGVKVISTTPRP